MWTWFGTWTPDLKLQGILIATEDAHKFNQQLSACISSISITLWVIAYMPGSTNYLILYDGYEFQKHHCKITWWSLKSGVGSFIVSFTLVHILPEYICFPLTFYARVNWKLWILGVIHTIYMSHSPF